MAASGFPGHSEHKSAGLGRATLFAVPPKLHPATLISPAGHLASWSSLECRHMASKLGLADYNKCWDFYANSENREPNLDAKTVPSWKDIAKENPLTHFRIQILYASLMDHHARQNDPDLDPLLKANYQLLMSPTWLGLCWDDPNVSPFGNQLNRNYGLYTYAMALYSVREAFREIIHSPDQNEKYNNLHHYHNGEPDDEKLQRQVIYTNLNINIKNQKFKIYNHIALGTGSIEVTCEEVKNQILVNLTPEGKFPADVKLSDNEIKQLQTATTFEGLEVNARNIAIAQIAKRKALEQTETLNLLTEATSLRMNQEVFTSALSKSPWGNSLIPYAAKLFQLSTLLDSSVTTLPLLQYLYLMSWLGEPSLTSEQAIPAPIAIDFYIKIFKKHTTAAKLFKGFVFRTEVDQLSERERKSLGPILRFNDGHLSFDGKSEPEFSHRTLVLSHYDNKAEGHQLMFKFNAGIIEEADKTWRTRLQCRKTQPKNSREFDLDLRQILHAFNNALSSRTEAQQQFEFKPIPAITILTCLQCNRLNPIAQTPEFDPTRGNRI